MTWGAFNELTTLTGYRAIMERSDHPVLIDLLRAIIEDERRHFAFYQAQARMRLRRSTRARRVARWAMEHLWAPVGTGVRPQEETDFVVVSLFGDYRGGLLLAELDAILRQLPGFDDAKLLQDARVAALRRLPPDKARGLATPTALARAGIHRVPPRPKLDAPPSTRQGTSLRQVLDPA